MKQVLRTFFITTTLLVASRSEAQLSLVWVPDYVLRGDSSVCVGKDEIVVHASVVSAPPYTCTPENLVCAFDSGDVSEFSFIYGPSGPLQPLQTLGTIHFNAKSAGKKSVAGELSFYGYWQQRYCPGGSYRFSITVFARNCPAGVDETERSDSSIIARIQNPFDGELLLRTDLAQSSNLQISLFNVTGKIVSHFDRACPAGPSEISLDASSLPAGCYWYVLRGADWIRSGKVMKWSEP